MHPLEFSKEDKITANSDPTTDLLRRKTVYVYAILCRRSDQHSWIPDASLCRFQHRNSHFLLTTACSSHLPNKAVIMEETPGEGGNDTRPLVRFDLLIKRSGTNPHRHRREPIKARSSPADGPFPAHMSKRRCSQTRSTLPAASEAKTIIV